MTNMHRETWDLVFAVQWCPVKHIKVYEHSDTSLGQITSNLSKLVIPLILWRTSDDKPLQSMTSWVWEVSLDGPRQGLEDLFTNTCGTIQQHQLGIHLWIPGLWMERGKMSLPLHIWSQCCTEGKALFMQPRLKCGSKAWGCNSLTLPSCSI